jgi:hypothetical protein
MPSAYFFIRETDMSTEYADIKTLRSTILDEIFAAFVFSRNGWARHHLWPLAWLPAHIFSKVGAGFDESVASFGFYEAARRVIPRFARGFEAFGQEHVPEEGSLLVVSNHPGSIDSLVIAANVPRKDFKIVAGKIPFINNLPATTRHMIYATPDTFDRMAVLRSAVEHLQGGGAMLIYPSGHVDPDPAVLPGAEEGLREWSRSVELFMRKVPQTQLLVTIVSDVVSRGYLNSPLTKIRKGLREKQKLAEFIQIMQQMVIPGSVNLFPRITFDTPLTMERLRAHMDHSIQDMHSIVERARLVLRDHMVSNFTQWEHKRA